MEQKYELLAPAGNFAMLVAAVNAGADAVYFGLQKFGMRANAKNFTIKDLDKMRGICNNGLDGRNVKMYVTLNTIVYNEELDSIEETVKKVKGKVDAVICWDLAVVNLCKKYGVDFFISTQASVANKESAKFYKELGAKRIVLARELNLEQIKEISKVIEIECFVHGAMCVAISGRCFTSQFLFGKSANRGECIHPCRRNYIVKCSNKNSNVERPSVVVRDKQEGWELEIDNDKVMSAKDLCTLPFIEKMKESGITGFKIEGRNRDARYVDAVVRVYRKALDNKLSEEEIKKGIKELEKVYNKGFSSGFYLGSPTADDFSKTEHSLAKEKKHFVGRVIHYFPKAQVAAIKLVSELKIGDEVVVIGEKTGVVKSKIERIEIHNKEISYGKKGQEVGVKIPNIKKNDQVYVLKK